jgi:outer membrane protein
MITMKKFALILLAVGLSFSTFAQKQKLAHINSQEIIRDLAAKDSIPQKLQKFAQELEAEYMRQQNALDQDIQKFMAEKATLSPQMAKMKESSLGARKQKLERETVPQFQQMAQQEEQKLALPLQEKLGAAIEKIAKENGYTYVLEEAATLYAGGTNITKLVRVALGLPAEALPQTAGLPVGR